MFSSTLKWYAVYAMAGACAFLYLSKVEEAKEMAENAEATARHAWDLALKAQRPADAKVQD